MVSGQPTSFRACRASIWRRSAKRGPVSGGRGTSHHRSGGIVMSTRERRHPGRRRRGSARGRRDQVEGLVPAATVGRLRPGERPRRAAEDEQAHGVGERRRVAAQREVDEVPGVGPVDEQRLTEDVGRYGGADRHRRALPDPRARRRVGLEHQPLGLAGASRAEQDVVALVLEQPLGLAPVECEQRGHRLAGVAGRSARRPPPPQSPPGRRPRAGRRGGTARGCR